MINRRKPAEADNFAWLDEYECGECAEKMNVEGDVLVCPACGHSVDVEDYATEHADQDGYDDYYPDGEDHEEDEEYTGETYDEVWGEVSRRMGRD